MKTPKRSQKKLTIGIHNSLFQGVVNATGGFRLRFLVLDSKLHDTECVATLRVYTAGEVKKLFGGDPQNFLNKHFEIKLSKNTYNDLLTIVSCTPKRFNVPEWYVNHCEDYQGCKNGAPLSETKKKYLAERQLKDPKFKITNDLRKITDMILAGVADDVAIRNVGCTSEQFRKHVEKSFKSGMKWSNRGTKWHLDHIVPLTAFDLTKKSECLNAIHYTNFQALEPEVNRKKYNNVPEPKPLNMAEKIDLYFAQQQNTVDKED